LRSEPALIPNRTMNDMAETRRIRLLWWLRVMIASSLLGYLLWFVGMDELLHTLQSATISGLVLGALAITAGFFLNGYSLFLLYDSDRSHPVKPADYFNAFYYSAYLSFWLPGRMGDFSISYLLRKTVPVSLSLIYVLMDKLITLLVLSIVGCLGVGYFFSWPAGILALSGCLAGWGFLLWVALHPATARFIGRLLPRRARPLLEQLGKTRVLFFSERRSALIGNMTVTLLRCAVVGLSVLFLLSAFGQRIDFGAAFYSVGLVQILSLFPITVQGIGVTEGIYILLLAPLGISEAAIIMFCFSGRVISILSVYLCHLLLSLRYSPTTRSS